MKIVDKPCERCGEMMFSVASIQKYCPNCRKAVEVERQKARTESVGTHESRMQLKNAVNSVERRSKRTAAIKSIVVSSAAVKRITRRAEGQCLNRRDGCRRRRLAPTKSRLPQTPRV